MPFFNIVFNNIIVEYVLKLYLMHVEVIKRLDLTQADSNYSRLLII